MTGGTPVVQVPTRTSQWTTPNPTAIASYAVPTASAPVVIPGAGVQTGIPQGGYAAPAIEQYLAGAGPTQALSYVPGQYDDWLASVADTTATGVNSLEEYANILEANDSDQPLTTTAGVTAAELQPVLNSNGELVVPVSDTVGMVDTLTNPYTGVGAYVPETSIVGMLLPGASIADDAASSVGSAGDSDSWMTDQENYGGATGGHWGGSADNETNLINSTVSDNDFWNAFENNDPSSVNNDGDPTNDIGNAGYGFTSITDMFDGGGPGASGDSYTGGIHGNNTVGDTSEGISSIGSSEGDNDSSSNSGDCVIATFAKAEGVDLNRREAVKWCMSTLHDNWAGELVRLGYQTLGRKAINAGKAREHFEEFKRYVDYARGQRKDIGAALTFYGRTSQFFIVGLWENYKCK